MGRPYPNQTCLFFSILKSVSFKNLNETGRVDGDEKIPKHVMFIFDFCFYFLFAFLFVLY